MHRILSAAAILLLLASPIGSQTSRTRATADVIFNVSTTGTDSGGCILSPCRSGQYAWTRVMNDWDFAGFQPYIKYAPGSAEGSYVGGIHMAGQPVGAYIVNVIGQQSPDTSCSLSQAEQVVVDGTAGSIIFDGQDGAIPIVRCLTVRAKCNNPCNLRESGVIGFNARQNVAADIAFVKFDALPGGVGVIAQSGGQINLGGVNWIGNNMGTFLFASSFSRITVAVPTVFLNGVNVDQFVRSYTSSFVEFYSSAVIGNPSFMNGQQYIVAYGGTLMTGGVTLPGTAGANVGGFVY